MAALLDCAQLAARRNLVAHNAISQPIPLQVVAHVAKIGEGRAIAELRKILKLPLDIPSHFDYLRIVGYRGSIIPDDGG